MLDIPSFLMRWLFLSGLLRDATEIQTLPQLVHRQSPTDHYQHPDVVPESSDHSMSHHYHEPTHLSVTQAEEAWRGHVIRRVLEQPPNSRNRLIVVDRVRQQLVYELQSELNWAERINRQFRIQQLRNLLLPHQPGEKIQANEATAAASESIAESTSPNDYVSEDQITRALLTRKQMHDNLPQLVTAVLKSPVLVSHNEHSLVPDQNGESMASLDDHGAARNNEDHFNPVQYLRHLVLNRCQLDPGWGIELCWLLEAEVGRAWKTLFEHRQQTGRRLILVLPAEKAAVLKQIGSSKREAFHMLQDVEQATAYGYAVANHDDGNNVPSSQDNADSSSWGNTRLPSSLSIRRCSHFGDTMNFVDQLSDISRDLRSIPVSQREVRVLIVAWTVHT
jgi:hypothetical protein